MNLKNVLRTTGLSLSLLALTALLPGCLVESQKARDIFLDGAAPRAIERLGNQFHELANVVGLTDRVAQEQNDPSLLPVAIIDNGVDLAHPDLVQKIAFDLENGRLVGAGYDFMAEDRWASSNLVNPLFFAFGAKEMRDGKLAGVHPRPLDYLHEVNTEFMKVLTAKIKAHPVLNQSLFSKIHSKNTSIVLALLMTEEKLFKIKDDSEEQEEPAEKLDYQLAHDTLDKMAADPEYKKQILDRYSNLDLTVILRQPWVMDKKSGGPRFDYEGYLGLFELIRFKNYKEFYQVAMEALNEIDAKTGIKSQYANYKKLFEASHKFTMKTDAVESVGQALYYKLNGPRAFDPMVGLAFNLQNVALEGAPKTGESIALDDQALSTALNDSLARYEEMVSYLSQAEGKSQSLTRQISTIQRSLGPIRELVEWYKSERSLNSSVAINPGESTPQASLYRRYLSRTAHPYLNEKSNGSTHGSHTSGIVAAQDPNIRLVPVRVTTEGMAMNKVELEKLKSKFKRQFGVWLQEPVVYRAVVTELKGIVQFDVADSASAARAKFATQLVDALSAKIDLAFEKGDLEFQFLDEIESAIRYVGERKIKIANVSLGTSFSAVTTSLSDLDQTAKLEALFDFLKYEYFKFRLGTAVRKYAPQTLFVVAAGNDGQWVDGRSRSALPVDISSPFLAAHESEAQGELAPNNRLTNILAVGSIGPEGRLSSFTNILLGSETPYVLAQGESILSPVKTTDLDSVTQLIEGKLPILLDSEIDSDAKDLLEEWYKSKVPSDTPENKIDKEASRIERPYELSQTVMKSLGEAIQLHLFLRFPNHRARLSGTSMATPAVTGLLGRMILEKAKQLNVPTTEIYAHPAFTPAKLVEDVFARVQPLDGSKGKGIALSRLMGDIQHTPTIGATATENLLNEAIRKGQQRTQVKEAVIQR